MSVKIGVSPKNELLYIERIKYYPKKNGSFPSRIRQDTSSNVTEFGFTGNIILFVISITGYYKLEAWGATGGSSSATTGPKGAYSRSYFYLEDNEEIQILVGEKGYPGANDGNNIHCGGGGGGTFIAKGREPLCVAGGGGSFVIYSYSSVSSFACGQSGQLGGNPGTGQGKLRMGGKGYESGGGGAGFEGNGEDGTQSYGRGGISFLNGGSRQTSGTYGENIAYGGFGGDGSRNGYCGYSAGGGGYSGGSASNDKISIQGGGGGSYFEGNYSSEASFAISGCDSSLPKNPGSNGNGYAIITLVKSMKGTDLVQAQLPCINYKGRFLWILYATLTSSR